MSKKESDADKMRRSIRAACRDLDWLKEVGQRRRQNHQIHKAAMRFIQGGARPDEEEGGPDSETSAEVKTRGHRDATPSSAGNKAVLAESLAESSSTTLISLEDEFDQDEGREGGRSLGSPDGLPGPGPGLEEIASPGPQGW